MSICECHLSSVVDIDYMPYVCCNECKNVTPSCSERFMLRASGIPDKAWGKFSHIRIEDNKILTNYELSKNEILNMESWVGSKGN